LVARHIGDPNSEAAEALAGVLGHGHASLCGGPPFRASQRKRQARRYGRKSAASTVVSPPNRSQPSPRSDARKAREQPRNLGGARAQIRRPRLAQLFRVSQSPSDSAHWNSGG